MCGHRDSAKPRHGTNTLPRGRVHEELPAVHARGQREGRARVGFAAMPLGCSTDPAEVAVRRRRNLGLYGGSGVTHLHLHLHLHTCTCTPAPAPAPVHMHAHCTHAPHTIRLGLIANVVCPCVRGCMRVGAPQRRGSDQCPRVPEHDDIRIKPQRSRRLMVRAGCISVCMQHATQWLANECRDRSLLWGLPL